MAEDASGADALNLKQVAAELGVHYMTAYRYVRAGRLDAVLEHGAWRVAPQAIVEFRSEVPAVEQPAGAHWAARVEPCLLAGDETAAWRVIEQALASGRDATYCYLEVVAAALNTIGERWAEGRLAVADQHVAAAVAVRLVARLGARFRRPGRSRGTVVFGAPPGELHSLPIAIVSDLVRLRGYDVLELGANVPVDAFVAAVLRTPRLICAGIGVTQVAGLDSAQQVIDAVLAEDRRIPILVGGLAAIEMGDRSLRGVTALARSGREAVALVEELAGSRAIRQVG